MDLSYGYSFSGTAHGTSLLSSRYPRNSGPSAFCLLPSQKGKDGARGRGGWGGLWTLNEGADGPSM